ncbi:unnamed protein product, partial [Rhizoctonia solani]
MPTTRQRTDTKSARRKGPGSMRNAAALTLSQVAKLVNLPVAQDVAHHIHQVTAALKPSVLQAPKNNDSNAKELAEHILRLLEVLDTAFPYLHDARELDRLCSQLRDALAQLESIQTSQYSNKLASQVQIQDHIVQLKEGISRTVAHLTLWLSVVTLTESTRDRQRTRKVLARTHQTITQYQDALMRVEERFAISDRRIQELGRICEGLRRQGCVDEAIPTYMRYTADWHRTYIG